jgi:hypothetical protein
MTSPNFTRPDILAPPNYTTNATQKTAPPTMAVDADFHNLLPLTSRIFLNIWLTYAFQKTFFAKYTRAKLS